MLLSILYFHILDKDISSYLAVLGFCDSSLRYGNKLGMKMYSCWFYLNLILKSRMSWLLWWQLHPQIPRESYVQYTASDSCPSLSMKVTLRVFPADCSYSDVLIPPLCMQQNKARLRFAARWTLIPRSPAVRGCLGYNLADYIFSYIFASFFIMFSGITIV